MIKCVYFPALPAHLMNLVAVHGAERLKRHYIWRQKFFFNHNRSLKCAKWSSLSAVVVRNCISDWIIWRQIGATPQVASFTCRYCHTPLCCTPWARQSCSSWHLPSGGARSSRCVLTSEVKRAALDVCHSPVPRLAVSCPSWGASRLFLLHGHRRRPPSTCVLRLDAPLTPRLGGCSSRHACTPR